MGVKSPVVHAESGLLVRRRVFGNLAYPDSPVIIFIPIGVVGSANITDRSLVLGPQQRFGKTFVFIEFARLAAIAYQQSILVLILQ